MHKCIICENENLKFVFDLGLICPSTFLKPEDISPSPTPLALVECPQCKLVQLSETFNLDDFYRQYWYQSGLNSSMVRSLQDIVTEVEKRTNLKDGDTVIDIGCFPSGKVVVDGFKCKDISEVSMGDKVLDLDGQFTNVIDTFQRKFDGELIEIKLRGCCGKYIKATSEHPFYAIKNPVNRPIGKIKFNNLLKEQRLEWVAAKDLKAGDYCVLPKVNLYSTEDSLFLSDYIKCIEDGAFVYATQRTKNGNLDKAHNQNPLPKSLKLTEDFGKLIGYYVAEGSEDGKEINSINFSFNEEETNYIDDVQSLLINLFGLSSSLKKNTGKSTSVRCSSSLLKQLLQNLTGSSAKNKTLPNFIWSAPSEFKIGLLQGIFRGDGSFVNQSKNKKNYTKYDTISEELAFQVKFFLLSYGINSSIVPNKPNGYGKNCGNVLWSVRICSSESLKKISSILNEKMTWAHKTNNKWPVYEEFTLVKIRDIKKTNFSGTVFNLKTESATYVMESAVVHNCNDATLFTLYSNQNLHKVGIDPALNLRETAEKRCDTFINDYFNGYNGKAKVITAIAMFYDLPNPHTFLNNIVKCLDDDGIFVIQMTDLLSMITTNAYDNICHEHMSVYSLKVLTNLLKIHGLEVFDLQYNDVNGGSLRVYVAFNGKRTVENTVAEALKNEEEFLHDNMWKYWKTTIDNIKDKVVKYISFKNRKDVYALGASTKGNTLLQYFGLSNKEIAYAADINPDKFGLRTVATNIPIISEKEAMAHLPEVFLVLPWHFRRQIISKNQDYLNNGGKFLFPLPIPQLVTKDGVIDL